MSVSIPRLAKAIIDGVHESNCDASCRETSTRCPRGLRLKPAIAAAHNVKALIDAGPRPALPTEDQMRAAITDAFEGWAQAWWTDDSGDVLARVAAEAVNRLIEARS